MFSHIYCNSMFQMFQLFQSYIAIVLSICFHKHVASGCPKYFICFQMYVAFECFMLQVQTANVGVHKGGQAVAKVGIFSRYGGFIKVEHV